MLSFQKTLQTVILRQCRNPSNFLRSSSNRGLATENKPFDDDKTEKTKGKKPQLPAIKSPFETASHKTKESYLDMVSIFENRDVHRRNHVEFIYAALKNMEEFGVHRDIEVYKSLINIMPKGKFIPTNIFQAEFMHYPKQQQCIIDLLEQMEDFGVIPDYEMEAMLLNVFGRRGHPVRKYWRMMYWMPKFKNLSPWSVPNPPPDDILELARMAVERMCSVDLQSKIDVFDTQDVQDSIDKTWIVSGMSSEQSDLLKSHIKPNPIYIEGPFMIWLRNKSVHYFTLRADPNVEQLQQYTEELNADADDVSNIQVPFFGKMSPPKPKSLAKLRSIHEQNDGTIFAVCATGTSTKDSLLSWIRLLEKENPALNEIPVLFRFKSIVEANIVPVENTNSNIHNLEEIKVKSKNAD